MTTLSRLSRFDPRELPAIGRYGALYVPGINAEPIAGTQSTRWGSLCAEPNSATDEHWGNKPVLKTLSSGRRYYDYAAAGQYGSFMVPTPGSAFQWTDVGAYWLWFYLSDATAASPAPVVLLSQWPNEAQSGGVPKRRIYVQKKDNDPGRLAVFGSRDGTAFDNGTAPDGIWKRYKWNDNMPGTAPILSAGWHSLLILFDTTEANYFGPAERPAGANCSSKLQVFFDGRWIEGFFTAPQPDPTWQGAPPLGPVQPLFASDHALTIGADGAANHVDAIGSWGVANGKVPFDAWTDVLNFWQPF